MENAVRTLALLALEALLHPLRELLVSWQVTPGTVLAQPEALSVGFLKSRETGKLQLWLFPLLSAGLSFMLLSLRFLSCERKVLTVIFGVAVRTP